MIESAGSIRTRTSATEHASTGVRVLAKTGYAARGMVYLVIASIAGMAAIGAAQPESSEGALESVFSMPLGSVLLAALALGLCAYSAWRLCQSILDADSHGRDLKAVVVRFGLFCSAITHLGLAVFAATLLFEWSPGGGQGSGGGRDWTAWLLQQPYGPVAMGVVAACIAGGGVAVTVKGVQAGFRKWMELDETPIHWLSPVCRFGLVVRGAILFGSGAFLGVAAWRADASENRGLKGLLELLQQQAFGVYLLGFVALGLLSFAVYSVVEAVYREIQGLDEW